MLASVKSLPTEKKTLNYIILLKSGATIAVTAENYDTHTDEDGNMHVYIFRKRQKPILEVEADSVKMVISKDDVDVEAAIQAIKKRPRKPKKA